MKLRIGILNCEAYVYRREVCRLTWVGDALRLGVPTVFLVGGPVAAAVHTDDRLICPCPDDAGHLSRKNLSFFRWAQNCNDWDYLFNCDDDTFVSVPRLVAYEPGGADYIGVPCLPGVASGGAGFLLSRRSVAILAAKLTHACHAADLAISAILQDSGISLTVDARFVQSGVNGGPRSGNDLITAHGCMPEFFRAHAETGLQAQGATK